MDRRHFEAWSRGLGAEDLAAAMAALGVLVALHEDRRSAGDAAPVATAAAGPRRGTGDLDALASFFERLSAEGGFRLAWRSPADLESMPWTSPEATGPAQGPGPGLIEAASLARAWRSYATHPRRPSLLLRPATRSLSRDPFVAYLAPSLTGAACLIPLEGSGPLRRPVRGRPATVAAMPGDGLGPALAGIGRDGSRVEGFQFAQLSSAAPEVDLLVSGADLAALDGRLTLPFEPRCTLVIVCGGTGGGARSDAAGKKSTGKLTASEAAGPLADWQAALAALPALRRVGKRLGAAAIALVTGSGFARETAPALAGRVGRIASGLAEGCALDRLLAEAFDGQVLALLDPALLEVSSRARGVTSPAGPRFEAAPPSPVQQTGARPAAPRFIQQRSFLARNGRFVPERSAYRAGVPVRIFVRIAPQGEAGWDSAPSPFPDHELPADRARHRLQVLFQEPRQLAEPLLREILLPRQGPSSEARFDFTPSVAGPFDARIAIVHRGRVLQTARLQCEVAAREESDRARGLAHGVRLLGEAQVRQDWSDLGSRRRYDLALVLNHGATDGVPRLTAVAGRRAWATSLEGIDEPLLQLNAALSNAARSVDDHDDGLDQGDNPQLLVTLARIGADLHSALVVDQLAALTAGGLDVSDERITHIQIVATRADAVVPLEFVYDYPPPDSDAMQVCPSHREALASGRCPEGCAGRTDSHAHACPMGFWGLRKVIERHLYSPALGKPDGAELVIQAESVEGRDRLTLAAGALVGYSRQVPDGAIRPLVERLSASLAGAVAEAPGWDDWKLAIGQRRPALLLAFPHNEGRRQDLRLEIGGSLLSTLKLPREYVRPEGAPPPLVFLLGCDVAGTAEQFANHVRYFRQAGAAAVVSTIATVFGEHAVRVGEQIVARLLLADGERPQRLGEAIRDARRQALLASVPMALCVVAFGDADWRL